MENFGGTRDPKEAAARMNAMYRLQRHIYDLTRKPYLLGRDVLIRELAVPVEGSVLEIGCGTARNLICIARRYPGANCHGIDVSDEMLATARANVMRAGLEANIHLAQVDASGIDPVALFGRTGFDRIVISYALSMIPEWENVLRNCSGLLYPGGRLHIVDFGDFDALGPCRKGISAWLELFSVSPRKTLGDDCRRIAAEFGGSCRFRQLYRGYVAIAELNVPS
jgi:S-adenosylmethionine-diacylgycerolhomoserine-N-methlytransferase